MSHPTSLQILIDASLFRSITVCIHGVPHFVHEFKERERGKHQHHKRNRKYNRVWNARNRIWWSRPSALKLWQVTVVCENKRVFNALLELSRATSSTDSDVDAPIEQRFPEMTGFAVTHTNNIELLDWLYANFTEPEHRKISADHFADLVDRGNLVIVRWIHGHGLEFPESILDAAAGLKNLELVQFLYEHGGRTSGGCLRQVMGLAAEFGCLDVIEYLFENNPEAFAAGRGCNRNHSYTLGYLHEREYGGCGPYFVPTAAKNGHLDCITFEHEHDFVGFTSKVMTDAVIQGHLDIVRYLHEN